MFMKHQKNNTHEMCRETFKRSQHIVNTVSWFVSTQSHILVFSTGKLTIIFQKYFRNKSRVSTRKSRNTHDLHGHAQQYIYHWKRRLPLILTNIISRSLCFHQQISTTYRKMYAYIESTLHLLVKQLLQAVRINQHTTNPRIQGLLSH